MESWNYGSEGKGFVLSDETVSNTDALARSRKVVLGWDLRSPFNFENTGLDSSSRDVDENLGFMELGFSDMARKPHPANFFGGAFDGNMVGEIVSSPTCMSNSKEFSQEDSSSRFSSVGDSSSRDSSLIDLKLGRLTNSQDTQIGKSSKEMPSISSAVCPVPEKRARMATLTYQSPVCQVHGCNMDLSSSKDYHKRHKVCDVHSKTAKVIVNGIEQRFCQQCSRFHLLAEFDDGKRSCRKRLAGHNERRRKPQVDIQTGRNGKLLLPYYGSRLLGTSLPNRTSFTNSNLFQSRMMQPVKYESSNWCRQFKLENEEFYSHHQMMPVTNENLLPKSSLPFFGVVKQYPILPSNSIDTAARSSISVNNNQYPNHLSNPDSVSGFVPRSAPSVREDVTVYDTASTIQGVSGVSDSSSALSLLSSQSQNSSSHSSGVPMGQSLLIQGNHAHYNLDQFSEKLFGISSQASTSLVSNRFSSSGEYDELDPIVASGASNSVGFDVHTEGIFQGSEFVSAKDRLSHEHTTTVDLLQLSSQLQRVEHQRHSMQVKEETDTFSSFPIA